MEKAYLIPFKVNVEIEPTEQDHNWYKVYINSKYAGTWFADSIKFTER